MGYDCTKKAMDTYEQLMNIINDDEVSNVFSANGVKYFVEIGQSNQNGSVTGSIYFMDGHKRGAFKISPEGEIVRFPMISKKIKRQAECDSIVNNILA